MYPIASGGHSPPDPHFRDLLFTYPAFQCVQDTPMRIAILHSLLPNMLDYIANRAGIKCY